MEKKIWDTELAQRMLAEGYRNPDIAKRVGISVSTLTIWKRREGLSKSRQIWKRLHEEVYATKDVQTVAGEAKRCGLSYGELVAGRENRVEINIPKGLTACGVRKVSAERNGAEVREYFWTENGTDGTRSAAEGLFSGGNGSVSEHRAFLPTEKGRVSV